MFILPRQLLSLLVCGLVLGCVLLVLLVAWPAQADVGVHPILPGGSNIQPEDDTPIQMTAEVVMMNVRPATEADNALITLNPEAYGLQFQPVWFSAIAEVQADFTMNNPTRDAVSLTAWFPLASALENVGWELNPDEIVPRIESFQVAVDGNPLNYAVSELPNPKGANRPLLPWASFPVTFPAGTETIIHVSYLLPLHHSVKGNELAVYYIFQTGAGWAGPIGQAELILNLPYPTSDKTLAGMPPGDLNLPYFISHTRAALPSGGVLEGNQARWTWKDFEPGPQDDFSIWLVDLGKYQELEAARAAQQANPQSGQAWLSLASIYHSLSTTAYNQPSVFSASYLPLGIEAYRKAADLLPEHPAPHVGLALLTLAPYMTGKDAPLQVIQTVQDEFNLARELEARNPSLAEEAGISSWMLEDVLSIYFYNDATATAEWAAWSTDWAKETAVAALLETPSTTPTQKLTLTPQPIPSTTPQPPPTALATHIETTGSGQIQVLIVTAGIIGLVIIGYLVLNRMRGSANK